MNRMYRMAAVGWLALSAGLATGCAATHGAKARAPRVVRAGESVLFQEHAWRVDAVQDDFVLMRYVPDTSAPGEIHGWVAEVLRIPRYELGQGRWALPKDVADGWLRWHGDDRFSLEREAPAAGPVAEAR